MPGIPFKYAETFKRLRRATEQLHALRDSGEFYTLGYLKRRALLRRVRKLYNRLAGPVSPAILRGAALAVGALALAGCTPPTGPADQTSPIAPVDEPSPIAQTPSFAAAQINPLGIDGGAGPDAGALGYLVLAGTDGDGDLDLHFLHGRFISKSHISYSVARQLRDGSGFAAPDTTWVRAGYRISDYAASNAKPLAFVDGDGDLDLISIGEDYYDGSAKDSRLVEHKGIATPTPPPIFFPDAGLPSYVRAAVFVDIDGDGDLDLVTATSDSLYLTLNTSGSASALTFVETNLFPFAEDVDPDFDIHGIAIVDLDKDGDLDLLVSGFTLDDSIRVPQVLFFRNQGTPASPSFGAAVANPFGITFPERNWSNSLAESTLSIVAADFDGDGDIDLLLGTYTTFDGDAQVYASEFFYFENKANP